MWHLHFFIVICNTEQEKRGLRMNTFVSHTKFYSENLAAAPFFQFLSGGSATVSFPFRATKVWRHGWGWSTLSWVTNRPVAMNHEDSSRIAHTSRTNNEVRQIFSCQCASTPSVHQYTDTTDTPIHRARTHTPIAARRPIIDCRTHTVARIHY